MQEWSAGLVLLCTGSGPCAWLGTGGTGSHTPPIAPPTCPVQRQPTGSERRLPDWQIDVIFCSVLIL